MSRARVAVALAWLAGLTVSLVWGTATGTGLPGMLMHWQIERLDSYSDVPAILAHLALAVPAIWMLLRHLTATGEDGGQSTANGRQFRIVATWLFAAATLVGLIGAVCLGLALRAGGYVEPVEIGAAQFASGDFPRDRPVRLQAQPVAGASYSYVIVRGRQGNRRRTWVGVTPVDGPSRGRARRPAPGAPVALFAERSGAAPRPTGGPISVSGLVVENGLPEQIRGKLERQGVRIADPHFVLRQDEERSYWLVGTALSFFLAFLFGLIGALLLMRGRTVGSVQ